MSPSFPFQPSHQKSKYVKLGRHSEHSFCPNPIKENSWVSKGVNWSSHFHRPCSRRCFGAQHLPQETNITKCETQCASGCRIVWSLEIVGKYQVMMKPEREKLQMSSRLPIPMTLITHMIQRIRYTSTTALEHIWTSIPLPRCDS